LKVVVWTIWLDFTALPSSEVHESPPVLVMEQSETFFVFQLTFVDTPFGTRGGDTVSVALGGGTPMHPEPTHPYLHILMTFPEHEETRFEPAQ
jgi:hypothetical protein